jgi:4-aminobutyrate aminotransferase
VLTHDDLDIAPDRALGHYTHEKNPVACAAGLATLDIIESEQLLKRTVELGEHARNRMQDMQRRHALIADVRGIGLLMGLELIDPDSGERAIDAAEDVLYRALSNGLSFKITMGNVLTLTPPLIVTQQQLDTAFDILDEAIGAAFHR